MTIESNLTEHNKSKPDFVRTFIESSSEDYDDLTRHLADYADHSDAGNKVVDNNITELETIVYNQTALSNVFKELLNVYNTNHLTTQDSRLLNLEYLCECLTIAYKLFEALILDPDNEQILTVLLKEFKTAKEKFCKAAEITEKAHKENIKLYDKELDPTFLPRVSNMEIALNRLEPGPFPSGLVLNFRDPLYFQLPHPGVPHSPFSPYTHLTLSEIISS